MLENAHIAYQVGPKRFHNKFQAAHYASLHNLQISFDLYENVFDQTNWSHSPELSWQTLLDLRAQQIAAKNKPIVFYFSGGTDSYTIYKVFERNNIHIDIVWMRAWEFGFEKASQEPVIDLMHNAFYDSTTKIVIQDGNELMSKKAYTNENWIWEQGIRYQYGIIGSDKNSNDEIAAMLGTDDFVAVIGFEKPRLLFDSTGVYSYQDDENYIRPMADNRFDCFYISPDLPLLHVKQSYMMLDYIKSLHPEEHSIESFFKYNAFHDASKFHWHDYSLKACGRFGDINFSQFAHWGNFNSSMTLPKNGVFSGNEYQGRARTDYLKFKHEQSFKNYTRGLMSVATDRAGQYLLQDPDNFYSIKPIRSKHYRLTF